MKRERLIGILTTALSFSVQDQNGILKVSTEYGTMYMPSLWWYPRWYLKLMFRVCNGEVLKGDWKATWEKLQDEAKVYRNQMDSS